MSDELSEERQRLVELGEGALADYFSEYHERLERIVAFRMDARIRGRVDPSDVLQDAYLQFARRLPEFIQNGQISLFVWIRQHTLQTLIDIHRQHFREKRDPNREVRYTAPSDGQSTSLSIARVLLDECTSPSLAVAKAEESERLQIALDSMQEIDREVLALRHFEQLSNQQVAEILGLSTTAASNRYIRAAARLGEIISEVNGQPSPGNSSNQQ